MKKGDEVIRLARVLVIDDEDVIGAVLRYALLEQGHETVTADGGRTGIEAARRQHPDAIVLDLMMPEVNGHDVLEALRENDATEDVPILVLTAVTQSRERDRCLAEGADRVMTKPFDPRDVANAVDGMLNLPPVPSFHHAS
jgi:DNA-binding response OmpR family regulator